MTNIKILFKFSQMKEKHAREAEVRRLKAIRLKKEAQERKERKKQQELLQKEKREKQAAALKQRKIERAAQQALELLDAAPVLGVDTDVHEDRRVTRQQASKKYSEERGKEVKTSKHA